MPYMRITLLAFQAFSFAWIKPVYGLEVLDVLLIASAVKTAGNAPCSQSSSLVGLEQKLRQWSVREVLDGVS